MTQHEIFSCPLTWPDGWPRTEPADRIAGVFRVSFARARDDLMEEFRQSGDDGGGIGWRRPVISTDAALRYDGLPKAGIERVRDPGVAVYFYRGDRRLVLAYDRYLDVTSNLRAIGLTVHNLRLIGRYGTGQLAGRAFSWFAGPPSGVGTGE